MEQYISTIHWGFFLRVAAVLIIGYLIIINLPVIKRIVTGRESRNERLRRLGSSLRVGYELIAVVILLILYLRVNVITHGIVLAVVILLAWSSIRNLLNGRFLRLSTNLRKGQEILFEGEESLVRSVGPLGLVLQTNTGTRIVDYTRLREHGLTLARGTQISNFLELTVYTEKDGPKPNATLEQLLLTCPYLDWSYRPEIQPHGLSNPELDLKVLLVDERYTQGFLSLIGEWGFKVLPEAAPISQPTATPATTKD